MNASDTRLAYLLLLLTTLFWGGNAVAGKLAVGHISPMMLTALRWTMASTILVIIGWPQLRRDWPVVKKHLLLLFGYGALGFAGFNIALYTALNHTSVINVAIEQGAIPALIFLGNYLLFRTRVTAAQVAGFSLTLVGVIMVASNGSLERLAALQFNQGDMWMALAGILYAGYSVALRYKPAIHWKSMMTIMALSALAASIPFGLWELTTPRAIVPDWRGLAVTAYTAIFPAIFAQIFYMRGIELIGANRAGLFINLVPIIGTVLAVLVLREPFGWHHAVAIVLVVGGIMIAERAGKTK